MGEGLTPGSQSTLDAPRPEDTALFLHTSGTTSRPKGVPLTQANLMASARNIAGHYRLTPEDTSLVVMPLFLVRLQERVGKRQDVLHRHLLYERRLEVVVDQDHAIDFLVRVEVGDAVRGYPAAPSARAMRRSAVVERCTVGYGPLETGMTTRPRTDRGRDMADRAAEEVDGTQDGARPPPGGQSRKAAERCQQERLP